MSEHEEDDLTLNEESFNEEGTTVELDEIEAQPGFEGLPDVESETEAEEVNGYIHGGVESEELESALEQEEGDESAVDAWYASYDDNPDEEVVIGRDDRTRVTKTKVYPWRAICSLRMRSKTGKNYIGTGWLISPRTVITAGHCVYFHNEGGWPESIEVIPGRNARSKPYGSCKATAFRSVTGWTKKRKRTHDYGAIILPTNCRFGERVGYFGVACLGNNSLKKKFLNLSGYPGDKPSGTHWYHGRKAKKLASRVITYDIDTAGGQSGSPVWYKSSKGRYGVGIHTSGHKSGNSATRFNKDVYERVLSWKKMGQ